MKANRSRRRIETLETRRLLAGDSTGTTLSMDINVDGYVSLSDPLRIINHLARSGGTQAVAPPSGESVDQVLLRMDINDDGVVSVRDALRIVNSLANNGDNDLTTRVLSQVRDRISESRPEIIDQLFGEASDVDVVIGQFIDTANEFRSSIGLSSDEAGQLIDDVTEVLEQGTFPSVLSLLRLAGTWENVWDDQVLEESERADLREAMSGVLESSGIQEQRATEIIDHIEDLYDRLTAQNGTERLHEELQSVVETLQEILINLPSR